MIDKNVIEKAYRLMLKAHGQQKRKTDNSPYVIHPLMVAKKLAQLDFPDAVIAAAMVHDVLEDSDVTEQTLRQELGDEVVDIILPLSEDKSLEWEERKKRYLEDVKNASIESKAVAIADKIHNLESLLASYKDLGPNIWTKFNRGRDQKINFEKQMLQAFKDSWDHPMIAEYEKLLEQVEKLD